LEIEKLLRERGDKDDWRILKAKAYAIACDKIAIGVSGLDWFPAFACWNRYNLPLGCMIAERAQFIATNCHPQATARMKRGNAVGEWMMWKDFDHSVPQWDQVLALGLTGLRQRVLKHYRPAPYYDSLLIVADASLRLVGRLAAQAEKVAATGGGPRAARQAQALRQLEKGAPRTTYEAMQLIYLFFVMSEHLDAMQCRSLSVIDQELWPFYRDDLAAGRTTEAEFREQFHHFLWQWGSIDNYWAQPVALGGTGPDGKSACNPLTKIMLEVADAYGQASPKLHLKVNFNMPDDVLDLALDMARRQRPLSFCGEEQMWKAMMSYGVSAEDARKCITRGCYEFCPPDAANSTDMADVTYLKSLEYMLLDAARGNYAAETYADFERDYMQRLRGLLVETMAVIDQLESHLEDVNPSGIGSLGVENSVRTGKDAFANGSAKGNNTNIETSGFGTTVDALMAVKEIVYERKEMSLAALGKLMLANWKGREDLRLRMLRSKRKWGTNDAEAKSVARRITRVASETVNHKPNARGGMYLLSGHGARAFVVIGKKIGATPDGRKAGEEMSKNLSAAIGADSEGVTALVNSFEALSPEDFPGDLPLDVAFLPSAVQGQKGLEVMKTALKVFYSHGGIMMQFNVVSAEQLRDAQAHPERYQNLQVRVSGWSVRWNDLPKVEQDKYIARAESLAQR